MTGDANQDVICGGCQCGKVQYRITGELGAAGMCHCRMCQRAVGNVFAPLVTASGVEWQGTPATWASSDIAERGFCAECGTPLFLRDFGWATGKYEIMIATLDDPNIAPPRHHTGIESMVDWLHFADGLPQKETDYTGTDGGGPETIRSNQFPAEQR